MRLSVVMAVRNGEPYVRDAIESVLSQSIGDFEFLIVDDASTDTTRQIVSSYERRDTRVRLLCNERTLGPYPSANRALHEARGEFVARHDADDISPPDRFAIQLAALQADASTALVTGAVEAFNSCGPGLVVRPPHWQPRLEWDLLFSNVVGAGAHVMFPRVFEGRPVSFPATHRYAEDYGMWCSLARRGRVVCPPDVVYRHRHHQTSISSSCRSEQDKCFAQQRHEYQSLYLGAGISPSVCGDLAQFWGGRGTLSLAEDLNRVGARLGELRAGFLGYVERRYGLADRGALERDLDEATVDRLAHWLTHAIRFKDGRTFRHLMALSSRMGLGTRVQSRLVAKIARSARRKLARTGAIARHASR